MATVLEYIAAVLPRLLFATHSIVALWLLVQFTPNQTIYWVFCAGLGCLFLESIYTIIVRKGVEYKYFWPSCFFYLCTLLPITWTAEWTLLEARRNNTTDDSNTHQILTGFVVGQEELKKFCEIGLMLLIILGRWMLPRGSITRDQLSMLLLEYVAIAADILELFEAFEDEEVARNKEITLATLGVFTWSLLQFTLVTTSMGKNEDEENEEDEDDKLNQFGVEDGLSRKYLRKAAEAKKREKRRKDVYRLHDEEADMEMRKLELQGDRYGIMAAMFMQDGPFLILRLYLVITYDFFNDSKFMFYIGKNIVSLLLMVYRLYVIHFHAKEEKFVLETSWGTKGFRTASFVLTVAQRFKSTKQSQRRTSRRGIKLPIKLNRWRKNITINKSPE